MSTLMLQTTVNASIALTTPGIEGVDPKGARTQLWVLAPRLLRILCAKLFSSFVAGQRNQGKHLALIPNDP